MKNDNLILFILDDSIPKVAEYVENSIYDSRISKNDLLYLLDTAEWKGQHSLKQLSSHILNSEHSKNGKIDVFGFTHPALCLDEIDGGLIPDIIIYDWEYEGESSTKSSDWLTEILNTTENTFVFVYSMVRDEIPAFLNKAEFDKYSHRFQLFLKGDEQSSVFSSEEFILQYILSKITKANRIKIHGFDIEFKENGYLENPSDILYIERILGRLSFLKKLEDKTLSDISDQSIECYFKDMGTKILYDKKRSILVASDYMLLADKIEDSIELSALQVLKRFGLSKIKEIFETGVAKV